MQQRIVLDQLYENHERVVALITRAWHWAEDESPSGEEQLAWLFQLRGARVRSWRPFEDRARGAGRGRFHPPRRRRLASPAAPSPAATGVAPLGAAKCKTLTVAETAQPNRYRRGSPKSASS